MTTATISQREAQALWNGLRAALISLDQNLQKIVETRAWEPLGYATFTEAWREQMSGVSMSGVQRVTAVYALMDSGASDNEVAMAVDGITPFRAERIRDAWAAGAKPHVAERNSRTERDAVAVSAHSRRAPSGQSSITVTGFSPEDIKEIKRLAHEIGETYQEWARHAIEDAMTRAVENGD